MSVVTRIRVWPRMAATGAVVAIALAGGNDGTPHFDGVRHYQAGLIADARFEASVSFDNDGWASRAVPTAGAVAWAPAEPGRLDPMAALYWPGAAIEIDRIKNGVVSRRLTGTVAEATIADGRLVITCADLAKKLDKPFTTASFAGTGGIEGGDFAAGRAKRRSFGLVWNVEGRLLDQANSIYEFGDPAFPLQGCIALRDMGRAGPLGLVAWQGSINATFTALKAATPQRGGGVFAPSIACAKWWTQPAGPLTADLKGEANGYSETLSGIAAQILAAVGGPSISDMGPARNATAGVHVGDNNETSAAILDRLLQRVALGWRLNATGSIEIWDYRFSDPIEALNATFIGRESSIQPVKSRQIGYRKNERVHGDGEISAAVQASDVVYEDGSTAEDYKPAEPGATNGASQQEKDQLAQLEADTVAAQVRMEQADAKISDLFETYGDSASAAQSALAAANSAQTAQDAKDNAQQARDQASEARTAAEQASASASGFADASSLSATASDQARGLAVTAKTASETARNQAEAAKADAETAFTNSASARDGSVAARQAAETARDNAQQYASNANGSATAAAGSASAATQKATDAGNSATAAAASQVSAASSYADAQALSYVSAPLLISTFREGAKHWTASRFGNPTTVASTPGTAVTDSDLGAALEISTWSGAGSNVLSKGVIPIVPGRIYEVTATFRFTASDGSVGMNVILGTMIAGYAQASVSYVGGPSTDCNGTGIFTLTRKFTVGGGTNITLIPVDVLTARPGLRMTTTETSVVLRVSEIRVNDVTEREAATAQANAAATSASAASTSAGASGQSATAAQQSATNALTSAGNANTSAQNASTSETNAAGSAGAALISQQAAAGSATTAGQKATAASDSAQTATTKATEAGQSSQAASQSATNASTSAGNANTYAGQASQSANNASGSANAASISAGAAAQSKTDAANSATSAAGSASTATTKATEAGQSATAANTSAVNAASSYTSAVGVVLTSLPEKYTTASDPYFSLNHVGSPQSLTPVLSNATASDGTPVYQMVVGSGQNLNWAQRADFTWTTAGQGVLTRGWVPTTAGRFYEVRARFRVRQGDGNYNFTIIGGWTDATGADVGNSFVQATTVDGTVQEIVVVFSDTASAGVFAWPANAIFARFGLRLNSAETGMIVRVGSIRVTDITEKRAAAGSASAAATSASNASTSAGNAGQSALSASGYANTAQQKSQDAASSAGAANASAAAADQSASSASQSATQASNFKGDAQSAATAASQQATVATNAAAAASSSATITAQVAAASINPNPVFSDWPNGQALPGNYTLWQTPTVYKMTGAQSPYAPMTVMASNTNASGGGLQSTPYTASQVIQNGMWLVLEVDARRGGASSDMRGACVLFRAIDSSGSTAQNFYVDLYADADIAGTSGNGNMGVRRWRKLVKVTSASAYGWRIYMMNRFSGTTSYVTAATENQIEWHRVAFRPATDQEIASKQATADISALAATVTTQAQTLSDLDTSYASLSQTVSAHDVSIESQSQAISSIEDGVETLFAKSSLLLTAGGVITGFENSTNGQTSAFKIRADIFELVPSASTGNRVAYSDGTFRIYAGATMTVWGAGFGSAGQFIEWTGPTQSNLANCTEANALKFVKTNGQAYYAGGIIAGTLKTSAASSSLNTSATATTGAIGSNGNPVSVNGSYALQARNYQTYPATTQGLNDYNAAIAAFGSASSTDGGFTHQGTKANNPSNGFTMTLKRNGANIGTYNAISGSITLNGAKPVPGDASGYIEWLYDYWSSVTLADPSVNTADRTYTAEFTRSFGTGGSVQSQRISVTSTEW